MDFLVDRWNVSQPFPNICIRRIDEYFRCKVWHFLVYKQFLFPSFSETESFFFINLKVLSLFVELLTLD